MRCGVTQPSRYTLNTDTLTNAMLPVFEPFKGTPSCHCLTLQLNTPSTHTQFLFFSLPLSFPLSLILSERSVSPISTKYKSCPV